LPPISVVMKHSHRELSLPNMAERTLHPHAPPQYSVTPHRSTKHRAHVISPSRDLILTNYTQVCLSLIRATIQVCLYNIHCAHGGGGLGRAAAEANTLLRTSLGLPPCRLAEFYPILKGQSSTVFVPLQSSLFFIRDSLCVTRGISKGYTGCRVTRGRACEKALCSVGMV